MTSIKTIILMAASRHDHILKRISEGTPANAIIGSSRDRAVLKELMEERMVEKTGENHLRLTSYGEIIQVMGYRIHQKKRNGINPKGKRVLSKYIGVILVLVFIVLAFAVYWIQS